MPTLIKPGVIAKALNITTSALRKRRARQDDHFNYLVDSETGRVNYILEELPPDVRSNVIKFTKSVNRSHEEAMKQDRRYALSIGKANARRIRIHEDEVAEKAKLQREKEERAALMMKARRDPRKTEKDYVKWTSGYTIGNYWNSIEDYENSKKKKKFTGYY